MPIPSPTTAKKFLYSSDFPTDKVIWRSPGSQSIPHANNASGSVTITIAHGLGYRPLVRGVYSENNFTDYYEIGSAPFFFFSGQWLPRINAAVSSDTTNVYLTFLNLDTTRTISWKLIGLLPSDAPATAKKITPKGDGKFYFNSDQNYLKLLYDVKIPATVPGWSDLLVSRTHSLGYHPRVMVWTEYGGKTYMSSTESTVGLVPITSIFYTTTAGFTCKLMSNTSSSTSVNVHLKLYVDE